MHSLTPRRRQRWRIIGLIGVVVVVAAVAAYFTVGNSWLRPTPQPTTPTASAPPPGAPWTSGAWTGERVNTTGVTEFGTWRGHEVAVATVYPGRDTWQLMKNSSWASEHFDGYPGRLSMGLPLLPKSNDGTLKEVADGLHDDVFQKIAQDLVTHGRGDSYIRVGLEANGPWYRHGATVETVPDFVNAYRHVVSVMRAVGPDLVFVFDISCGAPLQGSSDRLAPLTMLYPGDDVVDVVGCDVYDFHSTKVRSEEEWKSSGLTPSRGPGLSDLVTFAREHDKKFAVPEWGVAGPNSDGTGDNPFFIRKMYDFFYDNRDQLAYECYFNEPLTYIESSLYNPEQNPSAAKVYRDLWKRQ